MASTSWALAIGPVEAYLDVPGTITCGEEFADAPRSFHGEKFYIFSWMRREGEEKFRWGEEEERYREELRRGR